jgi:hypothetical protein
LTRYDNISIAIERATQQDVISELKKARPDVVIYNSLTGLTAWDGLPNMVRHYEVSAWILRNYHPVVDYAGYLLFARNSGRHAPAALTADTLSGATARSSLYADSVFPCDWGYVPNFFAQHPAKGARSRRLALESAGRHVVIVGRASQGRNLASEPIEVFLTQDGVRIGTGQISQHLGVFYSGVGFGFEIDAPIATGRPVGNLAVWVRSGDGVVRQVPNPGQKPDPAAGTIDNQRTVWEDRLTVPTEADGFHWLELTNRSGSAIAPDDFALSLVDDEMHGIYFSTRSKAPRPYVVRLDNCSQWKAMPGATVAFIHTQPQSELTVQLRS